MKELKFKNTSFLSNYYNCPIVINGYKFPSSENAYHSFKITDDTVLSRTPICEILTKVTPDEAKHFMKPLSAYYRKDWENYKIKAMNIVVYEKFKQNENLQKKLLQTGDAILIEDTTGWHDNFWGNCDCPQCQSISGKNHLGKILMSVRKYFMQNKNKDIKKW